MSLVQLSLGDYMQIHPDSAVVVISHGSEGMLKVIVLYPGFTKGTNPGDTSYCCSKIAVLISNCSVVRIHSTCLTKQNVVAIHKSCLLKRLSL